LRQLVDSFFSDPTADRTVSLLNDSIPAHTWDAAPRILVQSGCYELDNLGDQSMLQAAIDRVRARMPAARFSVLSRSTEGLKQLAPDARPVTVENRREWQWVHSSYIALRKGLPDVDPFIRTHFPHAFSRLLRVKASRLVNAQALDDTDFILLSGGGYFTDVFAGQAWSSLERIKAARKKNVPFAMVGHGLGPLRDPALLKATRDLLRDARLIGVRERVRSIPILESFGIPEDRIVSTGDDSVEHAWRVRKPQLGDALGVNLRVAAYAGTTETDVAIMHEAIEGVARQLRPSLVPVPVCVAASVESDSDAAVANRIVTGLPRAHIESPPTTVSELIERISMCRVVVTGSYHGAVFALAQGIPAVCIHGSEYYQSKFEGLAEQFGSGCIVVARNDRAFSGRIQDSVISAWRDADDLRPHLLSAASRQVQCGHRAYDRLAAIIARECGEADRSRPELVA
jgi:polysaccharide pyruvyl transferase WcaK-like protein